MPKNRTTPDEGEPRLHFRVVLAGEVRMDLRRPGPSAAKQILKQIDKKLTVDPVGYGDPLHRALAGFNKLRVAEFRVVYAVAEAQVVVDALTYVLRGGISGRLTAPAGVPKHLLPQSPLQGRRDAAAGP